MRPHPGAALPLLLLLASRMDAAQVLTFSGEGTRDGRAYRSTLTLRVSPSGVRVEATDLSPPGAPRTIVSLYVAVDDRIVPVDPPSGPVISAATIAAVEERARAAGRRRRPGAFSATPLGTTQSFGSFTCASWALRRPGQPTEIACLADSKALGIDETSRANLRKMGALFVPFLNAVRLAEGDAREELNAWSLEGGVPIRTFRSKDGVVEFDEQLVSVTDADLPPDLFRPPDVPAPALAPRAAPPAAPRPAPGPVITLEGWALRGMPAAGRIWSGADYEAAAGLLEEAARENPSRLPRGDSADTGSLYRRFVDPANLAAVSGAGDRDAKARAGAAVLSGVDRISLVYAAAYRDDASRGADLAGLMAYTLLAAHDVVPLADAAVSAAPKGDPLHAQRLASRKRTHAALASVVNACLVSLATPGAFRPEERLLLARAVADHVPALKAYLPDADRRALPGRLRKMSAREADPAVKGALDQARASLAAPAPKAA